MRLNSNSSGGAIVSNALATPAPLASCRACTVPSCATAWSGLNGSRVACVMITCGSSSRIRLVTQSARAFAERIVAGDRERGGRPRERSQRPGLHRVGSTLTAPPVCPATSRARPTRRARRTRARRACACRRCDRRRDRPAARRRSRRIPRRHQQGLPHRRTSSILTTAIVCTSSSAKAPALEQAVDQRRETVLDRRIRGLAESVDHGCSARLRGSPRRSSPTTPCQYLNRSEHRSATHHAAQLALARRSERLRRVVGWVTTICATPADCGRGDRSVDLGAAELPGRERGSVPRDDLGTSTSRSSRRTGPPATPAASNSSWMARQTGCFAGFGPSSRASFSASTVGSQTMRAPPRAAISTACAFRPPTPAFSVIEPSARTPGTAARTPPPARPSARSATSGRSPPGRGRRTGGPARDRRCAASPGRARRERAGRMPRGRARARGQKAQCPAAASSDSSSAPAASP